MEKFTLQHIGSVADVVTFFEYLLNVRRVSFHPDNDFCEYVELGTSRPSFSAEEVALFNRLMEESFQVCGAAGIDIYSIGLASLRRIIDPMLEDAVEEGQIVRQQGFSDLYLVRQSHQGRLTLSPLETDGPWLEVDECGVVAV